MLLKCMAASLSNCNRGLYLALGLFVAIQCSAQAQQPLAPAVSCRVAYVLPAATTAAAIRLLAGRTPTYVRLSHPAPEQVLLTFSFEPWRNIIPEYQVVLRTGNRCLQLQKKWYAVLLDYDQAFYPQKKYVHSIDVLNGLDLYLSDDGQIIKYTDWRKGKIDQR